MPRPEAHVVVVDDNNHFPLHVWRYLGRSLGFGTGAVDAWGHPAGGSSPDRAEPTTSEEPWITTEKELLTPDGQVALWWVRADRKWKQSLETLFKRLDRGPSAKVHVLVDIHGEKGYSAQEVCRFLETRTKAEIVLISAYRVGRPIVVKRKVEQVKPKSRETLHGLRLRLDEDARRGGWPPAPASSPEQLHILVTGAGFEIGSGRGGFGNPPTAEVLQGMEAPFYFGPEPSWCKEAEGDKRPIGLTWPDAEGGVPAPAAARAYPLPKKGIWTDAARDSIKHPAVRQDLDGYWDVLLERELAGFFPETFSEEREKLKIDALWRERRLREAFRRSLLRHDWGFMDQSLIAARLPLHAWLTTNYSHFANRAIALYGGDLAEERLGIWRIVSTAAEARTLLREHGDRRQDVRYLFKLHGDIAHLETMAIAGHDKDPFTPLTLPVEDFYQVYAEAEGYLRRSLPGSLEKSNREVVWHIVGHALHDRHLCKVLSSAWRSSPPESQRHLFVIVNPVLGGLVDRLREALNPERKKRDPEIVPCCATAGSYMPWLEWSLADVNKGRPTKLEDWKKAVAAAEQREAGG
jgi:hypothetical protein